MIAFCSLLILVSAKLVLSSNLTDKRVSLSITCEIGDVVQNECVKCVCTYYVYECTKLNCTKNATTPSTELKQRDVHKPQCHANFAYVLNSVTCLCGKNGTWPHPHCFSTFQALPHENITKEVCEPNTYVILDCNVCRCGFNGMIDKDRCTKNLCDKDKFVIKRRQGEEESANSKCTPKNWYSFAPCQFCYCVNENKLVCNTGNRNDGILELGSYKLTVCGDRLISDAEGLLPPAEKLLREGYTEKNDRSTTAKQIAADISASDEKKVMPKREGLSTQIPFEEDNDIEIVSEESNEHRENEMSINIDDGTKPTEPAEALTTTSELNSELNIVKLAQMVQQGQNMLTNSQNIMNGENSENNENSNGKEQMTFPQMLDKILSMALRKAMVKLEPGQQCEPGSTKKINCNVCFCLVNGKLLCTDKVCP